MPAAKKFAPPSDTITDLAHEFDLTPRAIRHYEEEGLISPRRIGSPAAPRRVYSARERVRVMLILRGKRLGMSLLEIKALFDLYDADKTERAQLEKFIEMLSERRRILEQQRADIADTLAEVNDVANQCRRILSERSAAKKRK
jgi:DNA-binding transcriptional MerR regulator